MKTHGNQPKRKSPFLTNVSAYVGQTCYVVHRLDMETSGLVLFDQKSFYPAYSQSLTGEKKRFLGEYWAQVDGHINSKELVFKDKIGR